MHWLKTNCHNLSIDVRIFGRYLLTLNEEINLQIVCDTLEDRCVLTPSDKDDVLQQGTYKDRIDTCIQRVLKTCPGGCNQFCEVLKDCGYNHVVESLRTETEDEDSISKCTKTKLSEYFSMHLLNLLIVHELVFTFLLFVFTDTLNSEDSNEKAAKVQKVCTFEKISTVKFKSLCHVHLSNLLFFIHRKFLCHVMVTRLYIRHTASVRKN